MNTNNKASHSHNKTKGAKHKGNSGNKPRKPRQGDGFFSIEQRARLVTS